MNALLSFYKKYWKTAFDLALIALTVFLIMYAFSFLYRIAAPIFIALVIFWIIEPLARFLHRRRIKKSIATGISMLVFILIILGLLTGVSALFIGQVTALAHNIPKYSGVLQYYIEFYAEDLGARIAALPPEVIDKAQEYLGFIASKGADISAWILLKLVAFVSSMSGFIFDFIVGVILAYFLSVEIDTWRKVATEKTPRTFKTAFMFLKENVLKGIGSYVKAQLKLISLTFIILYVALTLLRVESAFSVSLLAAVFDLLPLLGVSTIFIPWIIYLFIVGNTALALWLSGLLIAVVLVRQILEPKITGDSLGVSAFTMLSFMIVSLSLFGVAGLVLSPVLIILIKALYEQGYLKRWIRLPEEEYDS